MAKASDDTQDKVIRLTSLADLPSREVDVLIETEDQTIAIPCKELTYKRFQEIGRMVPEPEPKVVGAGPKGPIYSYSHPEYLQARMEAADKRMYLRIAEFVQLDIEGESLQDKADKLAEVLSVNIVNKLAEAMNKVQQEGDTRVTSRALTFQSA